MKLALGTVQFGLSYGIANASGKVSQSEARSIISHAGAHGIDLLDTAIAYGDSEACLGRIGVKEFRVMTKLPSIPEACSEAGLWAEEQLRGSLERLQVNSLYAVLLHSPLQLLGPHGISLLRTLYRLKHEGLIEKIGVSVYSPSELEQLVDMVEIDIVQAPFNIVDRRLETSGWLGRLKELGIEVHTRSAFLQGLLLLPRSTIPHKFKSWDRLWDNWNHWLAGHQADPVSVCLSCPLSFSEIDRVIVGVDTVEHLKELIMAAKRNDPMDFPDIACADEMLVNPFNWGSLQD